MDGYIISALILLFVLYSLVFMRGMSETYTDADVAEYKQKVMLMLAKAGKGAPIDIAAMSPEDLNSMFKDFLMIFNELQAKINGKPVTMADVQTTFPIDFLNEYNASISK
jgi:hypothetical protein